MEIEIRYFDDCPNWEQTQSLIDAVLDELGVEASIVTRRVETHEEAIALDFRGSPAVMVDGKDPFADPNAPVGLACRVYRSDAGMSGSPTADQLRSVLSRL